MKWTLLAAAALVLCCGLPFRTHETRTLLPVQTVQAERTEAGVRIVTEDGTAEAREYSVDDVTPEPKKKREKQPEKSEKQKKDKEKEKNNDVQEGQEQQEEKAQAAE